MAKTLASFVKMDFMTAKTGVKRRQILLIIFLTFLFLFIGRGLSQPVLMLIFLLNYFITVPFTVGENVGMDELYVKLNIKRKTVVAGRYIYALTLWLGGLAAGLAISFAGVFAEEMVGIHFYAVGAVFTAILASVMLLLALSLQLPMCFKLGGKKSQAFVRIPFIVVMLGSMAFAMWLFNAGDSLVYFVNFISVPLNLGIMLAALFAALVCILCISYRIAVKFYKNREF